ncbi:MAG: aryl-sulfate sulfotransferase, partial [Bryobacteraceae bacterium]|nr:aryl-sulfate sulfotransferase [Bryobacteraceae bacterium]
MILILCAMALSAATVEKNPNPSVPLAAVVKYPSTLGTRAEIEVSDGERRFTLRYDGAYPPDKGLPVVGMRPGRRHQLSLRVFNAAGKASRPEVLEYTTPPLPADVNEFPPLKVTIRKPAKMEPGFTLFSPRRAGKEPAFGARYGMLVAVNDRGEVVWYYRTDSRISDLERRPNGNILYVTQDFRVVEIDLLGNVVHQWYAARRPQGPASGAIPVDSLTFHHEVDVLPNGNLVVLGSEVREIDNYFTSEEDEKAPRKRQRVMGDEVLEFDMAGKVVWRWKAFDFLDPYRIGYDTFDGYWFRRGFPGVIDFSHANGILHDPADDSLLINFRIQSAVVKVDRKSGQIKWIAGEPEGWPEHLQDKLFRMQGPGRWFYHQHCPQMTPRGTLLLYDNGNYGARPFKTPVDMRSTYSRAVEYAIDERNRTLREVWTSEQKGPDSALSTAMGDVQWLARTGNVLAHYGSAMAPSVAWQRTDWKVFHEAANWSRIREFTHTSPAEV